VRQTLKTTGIAVLIFAQCSLAQAWREVHSNYSKYTVSSGGTVIERGSLYIEDNDTTAASKVLWSLALPFDSADVELALPYHWAGGLQHLSGHKFLASGLTWSTSGAGPGKMLLLTLQSTPSRQIVPSGEVTLAGIDPMFCAWNSSENLIYVVNYGNTSSTKSIMTAPWGGAGNPLPPASAYTVRITGTQLGMLDSDDIFEMEAALNGAGVYMWDGEGNRMRFSNDGSAWTAVRDPVVVNPPTTGWHVEDRWVPAIGSFLVLGPVGQATISDVDTGTVYLTVQTLLDQTPTSVTSSSFFNLFPGRKFVLQGGAGLQKAYFRPTVRYGQPQSAGGNTPHQGHPAPSATCVGQTLRMVGGSLDLGVAATQDYTHYAELWTNVRNIGETDPVTFVGNAAILTPISIIPASTEVMKDDESVPLIVRQAIPDDPSLEGLTLLYQFVIVNPDQTVAYSDVFGTSILASETTSHTQRKAWKAPDKLSREDMRRAWKWLGATNTGKLLPTKMAECRILLRKMIETARKNRAR